MLGACQIHTSVYLPTQTAQSWNGVRMSLHEPAHILCFYPVTCGSTVRFVVWVLMCLGGVLAAYPSQQLLGCTCVAIQSGPNLGRSIAVGDLLLWWLFQGRYVECAHLHEVGLHLVSAFACLAAAGTEYCCRVFRCLAKPLWSAVSSSSGRLVPVLTTCWFLDAELPVGLYNKAPL